MTIRTTLLALMFSVLAMLTGCGENDAKIASQNLSQAADNFQIARRIVFYNGVTGDYILVIQGLCSLEPTERKLAVTCKDGTAYKKHFLGLSDNVTYFAEQLDASNVSTQRYRVVFKPASIIPDVELK